MLARLYLNLFNPFMSEQLPESKLVFQDTTKDGLLTLTVWVDSQTQTELMRDVGAKAMGILRIYNNVGMTLQHEERVPLSHGSVSGAGPSVEEANYWAKLINQFYTDYD